MDLSFKNFAKMMVLIVLPVMAWIISYAVLISLINNDIIEIIVFCLTVTPFMFIIFKTIYKLSDKIEL